MAVNNFEDIYQKFFETVTQADGYVTYSRKLEDFDSITTSQCPALFQVQKSEKPVQSRGLPTKWTLKIALYIYCRTSDPKESGSKVLNPLLDDLRQLLGFEPDTGTQTLDGLVSHAWISSDGIEIFEGVQDNLTVAIVPIEILTNI